MRQRFAAALALLAFCFGLASASHAANDSEGFPPELVKIAESLHPESGAVHMATAFATLDLGQDYDFYSGSDVRAILVDLWGNPPGSEDGALGIVIPHGVSPLSDTWGAVVSFEDVGFVSDDDAAETDFDGILEQLKQEAEDSNTERRQSGYPAVHLIGWAENPKYDAATHSVVWARDLRFEGGDVDTLNYDLRTLGRYGVLSVNFVSVISELPDIRKAANTFAQHARFDQGARYVDFDPSLDKKAEYGIGGLIAAGAGVAVAKKLGLLAILAKFGKVIFAALAVGIAAGWRFLRSLFVREHEVDGHDEHYDDDSSSVVLGDEQAPDGSAAARDDDPPVNG